MYQNLLRDANFLRLLFRLDRDVARQARSRGCRDPACAGALHRANYARRPRGAPEVLPAALGEDHRLRLSFCCAVEGCRKRLTPPSFRFFGRKVYLGAVVVLVSILRDGPTPMRLDRLYELVGVDPATVRRWRQWWREGFIQTRVWVESRGLLARPVDERGLPASLLERFGCHIDLQEGLVKFLRLLGPLTTSSGHPS